LSRVARGATGRARVALGVALALAVALPGCSKVRAWRRGGGVAQAPGKPPFEPFVPGEWHSPKGDVVAHAPEAAAHPWRVLMLQDSPRPKKNPRFAPIPIEASGELEMPKGSRWRCLYNPVSFRPETDEHMKEVESWELLRATRCSSDGWRTYTQSLYSIKYGPDGAVLARSSEQSELYLTDTVGGQPLQMTIILRPQ
jgi:hypothetical protein